MMVKNVKLHDSFGGQRKARSLTLARSTFVMFHPRSSEKTAFAGEFNRRNEFQTTECPSEKVIIQ